MVVNTLKLGAGDFPDRLVNIPGPPGVLYHTGAPLSELLVRPCVTIVGSRRVSAYGRQVTTDLASHLAELGVVIISGLAIGIDSIAHTAALQAGGTAIGVLPSPLQDIVPHASRPLAKQILAQGGALISEYPPGTPPTKQNFVARNRLMSGLGQAVVVTEAGVKSGSLHTASFGLEQGRFVFAIPGNINEPGRIGANNLLKQGADALTSYDDVLQALGLFDRQRPLRTIKGDTIEEQTVVNLLLKGICDGDELLERSQLPISSFNQALTMLELAGKVRALGANQWAPI